MLGNIPRYRTASNRAQTVRRLVIAGALAATVPLAYLAALAIKLVNA